MEYPRHFIRATAEYDTFEKHIPAPCFRRTFEATGGTARIVIGVSGRILPEPGFCFTDGHRVKPLASGSYLLKKC